MILDDRAFGHGRAGRWRAGAERAASVRRRWLPALVVAVAAAAPAHLQAADAPKRVAVLDIELLKADYLPDAHTVTTDERRRLDIVAGLIRTRLRAEGYDAVPVDATRAAVRAARPLQRLHACNGCERDIARSLSADWVLVGWVQFVSNLILNLNVVAIDVETGASVAHAFVDLRGNTERSWRHATTYLLDHILVDRLAARR